jgi:hypothetical protein
VFGVQFSVFGIISWSGVLVVLSNAMPEASFFLLNAIPEGELWYRGFALFNAMPQVSN